jgi:hypothetical protein
MKIEILVSNDKKSFFLVVDGAPPILMENFILLTKEGDKTRNLVFGSPENVGRLLYSLYVNCYRLDETAMRDVMEMVADDILDVRTQREDESQRTIRKLM